MEASTIRISATLEAQPAIPQQAEALAGFVRRNAEHLIRHLPALAALDTVEAARIHLEGAAGRADRDEILEWYLFDDGTLCGGLRLNKIEPGNRKTSIAYMIDAACQGRGLALRSVRALLGFAFHELGMNRVELTCATDNLKSARLAERAGFLREGLLRQAEWLNGAFADHYIYGLLRSEFLAAAPELIS